MRIQTNFFGVAVFCTVGLFSLSAAAASGAEMQSRVKLSSVPEERVGLRSSSAPVTEIALAPTAKDFETAAANSKYAQPKASGLSAMLGIKVPPVRGAAPLPLGWVLPSGAEASLAQWEPVAGGGQVTHFRVTSVGAKGIRAKLKLPTGLTQGELRVVGRLGEDAEVVPLRVALNGEIWTPYTDGPTQIVELFTTQRVDGFKPGVDDVAHFEVSPWSVKDPAEPARNTASAGSCTVDVACAIGDDPVNGAAISERRKSVARMTYISGGRPFACTGTLINSSAVSASIILIWPAAAADAIRF